MKYFLSLLFFLLAVTVIVVANGNTTMPPVYDDRHIAVSIFPLYDIAKNIAGDDVEVTLMLPAGASPHAFEPTPSLAASLQGVDAIYIVGYGLDDWAKGLAIAPTLPMGAYATLITRELATDPHYWLTIDNAKALAKMAAEDLAFRYPELAATFQANLLTYTAELDDADAQIRATLDTIEETRIVTMHDAWYYFAQAYGLTVLGTFEPSGGREPTARDIADLAARMETAGVTTLFVDAGESEAAVDAFVADNNFTVVTVDPEGAAQPNSYIDMMLANAEAFSENR